LDSLGRYQVENGLEFGDVIIQNIRKFLDLQAERELNLATFTFEHLPQQKNGVDCGIFCLDLYLLYYSEKD